MKICGNLKREKIYNLNEKVYDSSITIPLLRSKQMLCINKKKEFKIKKTKLNSKK